MPNPLAWLFGIGKPLGELAEGGGKVLDQTANNNGNRVVIGLLLAAVIFLIYDKATSGTKTETVTAAQQVKIDDGKNLVIQLYKDQHNEDTAKIGRQDVEIRELRKMVADATESLKRQNSIIDIQKSQQK